MLHTVIFIGRSGCGKGTQAALFMERITRMDQGRQRILYVETGERFRKFIRGVSYSSKLSEEVYETDARQPDFLAGLMWGEMLLEELGPEMHIVFDGTPRSELEAKLMDTALRFYKRERVTVIHIDVSRRWSEEKLLGRGRSDDVNIIKIDKRLDWFDLDVVPALDYLRANEAYRVLDVNGEQTVEEVHNEIIQKYDYSK